MLYTALGLALIALAAAAGASLGSAHKKLPEIVSAIDEDEPGMHTIERPQQNKKVKTHWREDDGHLYPIIAAGNEDADAEYEDADAEEIESIALAPKGPKDRAIID